MLGRGVGLIEFISDPPLSPKGAWCEDVVWDFASCGLYGEARRNLPADPEEFVHATGWDSPIEAVWVEWTSFANRIHLAADIDTFLAIREADPRTFTLARDCRRELDLLLILADLCEDLQMPRSSEQARHLHAMVCEMHD